MELTDINISDDEIQLKDDDNKLTVEKLGNLSEIHVYRVVISGANELFLGLFFVLGIVFPPIFLYFIWRWYKAWKNHDKQHLVLFFEGSDGLIENKTYMTSRFPPSEVAAKIEELNKVVKEKGLKVKLIQEEKLRV